MLISLQPVFIRPFGQGKEAQSMQFIGDVVVGNGAQFQGDLESTSLSLDYSYSARETVRQNFGRRDFID